MGKDPGSIFRFARQIGFLVLLAFTSGCPQASGPPPSPPPQDDSVEPLRLIVVDDPPLAEAVQREWQARAEGELQVRRMSTDELLDDRRQRLAADAILYPSGLIGDLAEREWIVPIADEVFNGPEFGRRDIFDHLRQHEIVWGEQVFAVPLGSPSLVLLYRPDVLEALGAKPPQTWEDYLSLSKRLAPQGGTAEGGAATDQLRSAVAEPLGSGWAGQLLLARAAVYARHRSYYSTLFDLATMEPRIASPPFVKALEELVEASTYGPAEAVDYTPADVLRLLQSGRCVMGVTWPSAAVTRAEASSPADLPPVALAAAELPASSRVYNFEDQAWQRRESSETGHVTLLSVAGRMGSVAKGARRSKAALDMLLRLSSAQWSRDVSPHSPATTLYRTTQIPDAAEWVGESFEADARADYAELLGRIFRRPLWLCSVRLPGRSRYLAALDDAVHAAVRGDESPANCLAQAAKTWQAITEELGVERQRSAYWRSLGMEP